EFQLAGPSGLPFSFARQHYTEPALQRVHPFFLGFHLTLFPVPVAGNDQFVWGESSAAVGGGQSANLVLCEVRVGRGLVVVAHLAEVLQTARKHGEGIFGFPVRVWPFPLDRPCCV